MRLELVERGIGGARDMHHRHRFDRHRSQDDVGAALIGDRDVERPQPLLRALTLPFQLRTAPLEGLAKVAAGHQPPDLIQRQPELAQGQDATQLRQLGGRVVAVVVRRIHPHRSEDPELVVGTQLLGGEPAEARE